MAIKRPGGPEPIWTSCVSARDSHYPLGYSSDAQQMLVEALLEVMKEDLLIQR